MVNELLLISIIRLINEQTNNQGSLSFHIYLHVELMTGKWSMKRNLNKLMMLIKQAMLQNQWNKL